MKPMFVMVAALATVGSVVAQTLPEQLADGVVVEAAWLRDAADGSELYLVINNLSAAAIEVTGIEVEGIPGTFTAGDGPREVLSIPYHAELYMTDDGIRVSLPVSFGPEQRVPVSISTSTGEALTIQATVLAADAELPDHHDYAH